MELVAQIGGLAGLASLAGVLFAFVVKYRKGSTDAFEAASGRSMPAWSLLGRISIRK
jgi:hypothetical protein